MFLHSKCKYVVSLLNTIQAFVLFFIYSGETAAGSSSPPKIDVIAPTAGGLRSADDFNLKQFINNAFSGTEYQSGSPITNVRYDNSASENEYVVFNQHGNIITPCESLCNLDATTTRECFNYCPEYLNQQIDASLHGLYPDKSDGPPMHFCLFHVIKYVNKIGNVSGAGIKVPQIWQHESEEWWRPNFYRNHFAEIQVLSEKERIWRSLKK